MIAFVFVVVVAVAVGVVAFAMRGRAERGIESGIDSFRRELNALAPRGDSAPKRPHRTPIVTRDDDEDEVRTVQIGERPPPRRPTPKVEPTGVPAPSSGDAPSQDDETTDDEVTPPPVEDEADDGT